MSAETIKKALKEKERKYAEGKKTEKYFHTFPLQWNPEISFRNLSQLEYCPDNIVNQKCRINVLSRDSSVTIVTRILAGRQRDRGSIPGIFSSFL